MCVCEEAVYNIEMNLYHKHYFIEEVTPFSSYYISHIETEDETKHMKEYDSKRNKYRTARYLLKSSELVKMLFEKEYFNPITYGHYMILNTEFHKFQDSDSIDYDLHFDKDYCSKLIINKKTKKTKNKRFILQILNQM